MFLRVRICAHPRRGASGGLPWGFIAQREREFGRRCARTWQTTTVFWRSAPRRRAAVRAWRSAGESGPAPPSEPAGQCGDGGLRAARIFGVGRRAEANVPKRLRCGFVRLRSGFGRARSRKSGFGREKPDRTACCLWCGVREIIGELYGTVADLSLSLRACASLQSWVPPQIVVKRGTNHRIVNAECIERQVLAAR